jgi:crotonobetainyl-CoA:carnitine CoA-transferase CaiB-like acyl-CoA transferase
VPTLGADNAAVLSGILGYSKDRIAALYEQRILSDAGSAR